MTNNHLYWTVTTILQEQSGTRRAEIVKHMIKIASVLLSLNSVVVHHIVILFVNAVGNFVYLGILLPSLGYLKDLRNYNTMFAILRYCICTCVCVCVCVCLCVFVYVLYYCGMYA